MSLYERIESAKKYIQVERYRISDYLEGMFKWWCLPFEQERLVYVPPRSLLIYYENHEKNKRGSTRGRHERGQRRKVKDKGGEKGDKRRKDRSGKRRRK